MSDSELFLTEYYSDIAWDNEFEITMILAAAKETGENRK